MASQSRTVASPKAKRAVGRRNGNGNGNGHAKRARSPARRRTADIGELEKIIRNLEDRIAYLTSGHGIRSAVSGATSEVGRVVTRASNHVGDMVGDTLTDVAGRMRGSATAVTGVARSGANAMHKVATELERRPLMTVAIALGIGFLAGMAGRREQAS